MKILIYNAHIVSPQVNIACGAVLLNGATIEQVFEEGEHLPEVSDAVDAKGALLVPGFIDIHTHGIGGYDVCDATLEAITEISKLKLQEGTTSYCPTTLTLSHDHLAEALKAVAKYRKEEKYAKVIGVHLEGPFVNNAYIGAQNPNHVRLPAIEEVKILHDITPVAIVTYAPELERGQDFTKALHALGIVPSAGHSSASCACIREAEGNGLKHLTHFCNQMSPLHHREIGMVGAGLMDDDLLIELIGDKVHLSEDMLRLVYQLKHIDKIAVITDSLSATALVDGDYALGGLPIYVKGNEARLKQNDRLAGSTLRMNMALKNVVDVTGLPIENVIQTTSYNQAQSLGLDKLGKVAPGFVADLVFLDDRFNVVSVLKNGEFII